MFNQCGKYLRRLNLQYTQTSMSKANRILKQKPAIGMVLKNLPKHLADTIINHPKQTIREVFLMLPKTRTGYL